jgi:hypothetical protein
MTGAVRGRLVSSSFVRTLLPQMAGARRMPSAAVRRLEAWAERCEDALGPAAPVRVVTEVAVLPLLDLLGLEVTARDDAPDACRLRIGADGPVVAFCIVVPWGTPLDRVWPAAVKGVIEYDLRWGLCSNGQALRIVDGQRTWTREHLEFDLVQIAAAEGARDLLWTLVRGEALSAAPALLDLAVERSARHGLHVCRALGTGVLDALRLFIEALAGRAGGRQAAKRLFDHSLTVLYRLLFLHFAEARGLVPLWHPVYRDRYSLDAIVTTLLAGGEVRGLWPAVQAISRLAHAGCHAGALKVTAFNGRLFAPSEAAVFDAVRLDDRALRDAVLAVSTAPLRSPGRTTAAQAPRHRIAYADLDVEQLGAVYERVLEYEPSPDAVAAPLLRSRDGRKASGSFYTPRGVTAALVHGTLEPLVRGRDTEGILALRVLDPAMGSGAFLVAACRYLARAAEDALVREGRWHPGDITPDDRSMLRRTIASRCLFGVDLNPTAVHLGRLSLWLATLAADRPLSFLDHHLVAGNSLIGATPDDLARQPGGPGGRTRRPDPLPLFGGDDLPRALDRAAHARLALAIQPDDTAAVVRDKERTLAALEGDDDARRRWRQALDLWCGGWFWADGEPLGHRTFRDLCAGLLGGHMALPAHAAAPLLERAAAVAARERFLHWPLAFPEVFARPAMPGHPPDGGFDAVLGNPPWEMVRGDSGDSSLRDTRRHRARQLTRFVHESGIYRVSGQAHLNQYQLFLERGLQLLRPGGRLGFVLPGGVATDTGAAALRRHLFDRADVESIVGMDNRQGVFPIHRSVRFVLLSCTAGRPTGEVACRFGVSRVEDLGRSGEAAGGAPLVLTKRFLARVSGEDDLGIPECRSAADLRILERMSARWPWLGSPDGWHVRFGRELNATDDRRWFEPRRTGDGRGQPVVEGKHVGPFQVALDACLRQLAPGAPADLAVSRLPRLAYRDVASATNRLTLIAAIVPAEAVTTHTLFVVKTPLGLDAQHALCALLNSFVANYLVRRRVNTHVTTALVSRLFVPAPRHGDPRLARLAALSRALGAAGVPAETRREYADVQALAAWLYGLTADEFRHILGTFPLVGEETRAASLARFEALCRP